MKIEIIVGVAILLSLTITVIILATIVSKKKKELDEVKRNYEEEKKALNSKHANDISLIKSDCEKQIQQIQAQSEERVQQVKEQIESRKDVLVQMEEKELLANVMIVLDRYAGRFDQIEKQLTDAQDEQSISHILKSINSDVEKIKKNVCGKYSYGTLASTIEAIYNEID